MLDKLKGELRVFTKEVKAKDHNRVIFNTCIGYTKNEDEYINYYVPVNFSKAVKEDVAKVYKQESFDILLKDGWIKAYRDKDDNVKPILFVNEATIVIDEEPKKKETKASKKKADQDDDSLPF